MAWGVWGVGLPPQISPRRAHDARLVKGITISASMGPYSMMQGSCVRGGATGGAVVAALLLCACARLHCMAHGLPMQPSPWSLPHRPCAHFKNACRVIGSSNVYALDFGRIGQGF
jgi:hypothetical protein